MSTKITGYNINQENAIESIGSIGDVSLTSPAQNQIFKYDGSNWINDSLFVPSAITDLGITDGTDGQVLTTDGLGNYTFQTPTPETITSISIAGNILSYVDESGSTTNIDLSLYLDDTNLARIVSGTLDGVTGIATFSRDDATEFTIDFSPLFDDTNLSRIDAASFSNGTLTLTRDDLTTAATVSLDGRYLQDLTTSSTDDLVEGLTNLYYTDARVDANFATKTTTDLTEGTNLYYTDARVDARIPTAISSFTNDTGYLTTETTTTLSVAGNILSYVDETGTTTNIDLSLYLDDTNLARLVSGTLDGVTGIATFTRDDATTFTIDFSPFFDNTNLSRIDSSSFENGTLTLTRDDASVATTISLDGRYLQDLNSLTTDDLPEGATNLYYTDARVDARISAVNPVLSIDDLSDVDTTTILPSSNQILTWDEVSSKWKPTNFGVSSVGDPHFNNVSLLMKFENTGDPSDLSTAKNSINLRTNGSISSVQSKFGTYSLSTSSTATNGAYTPTVTTGSPLDLYTYKPDFTIECWVYPTAYPNGTNEFSATIIAQGPVGYGAGYAPVSIAMTQAGAFNAQWNIDNTGTGNRSIPSAAGQALNQWHHLALCRKADTIYFFVNGELINTATETDSFWDGNSGWTFGEGTNSTYRFIGYIDEVRVTKGVARYTDTFNVPTSSFPTLQQSEYAYDTLSSLADVNTTTTAPTDGQALIWDETNSIWIPGTVASSSGASVTVSETAPSNPNEGDLWFDSGISGELSVYESSSSTWISTAVPTTISALNNIGDVDTASTPPIDGQALVWDETNSIWVPGTVASSSGASVIVSDTAPANPNDGDLWFDSTELKTFIYYNDGTSSQWVDISGTVPQLSIDNLTDVDISSVAPTIGQSLVYDGTNFVPGDISAPTSYTTTDFNTDFANKTTDDLSEGTTNLYYTDARVNANIATKTTTDLTEGDNLYYTDSRVQTKLASVSGSIIPDTDVAYDLGSPTNKFRDLYLSGNSITLGAIVLTENSGSLLVTPSVGGSVNTFATESYVDTAISNLVDTAPTTLDTLNELAAALGDDPNFATSITTLIGTKLSLSGGTMTGNIDMGNHELVNVNYIVFRDPGPNEGLRWTGGNIELFESPDDLSTNTSGNLQITYGGTRKLTVNSTGIDVNGNIILPPSATITAGSSNSINFGNSSLIGVDKIAINDPGPNEGIEWLGGNAWQIYESPDDLSTNSGGNLQFVTGSPTSGITPVRRMTLDTSGNLSLLTGSFIGDLTGNADTATTATTVSDISNHTTDTLTEGSNNLYYTDERVDARISNASLGAASITYTPTPRYARYGLLSSQTVSTSNATILWETVSKDTTPNSIFTSAMNASTGEFTVPEGVTKIVLKTSLADVSSATGQLIVSYLLNDVRFDGSTNLDNESTGAEYSIGFSSIIDVVQGDKIKVLVYADTTRSVDPSWASWFEIQAVEGDILNTTVSTTLLLEHISDVDTTTTAPTDGQTLVWDSTNSIWIPGTVATASTWSEKNTNYTAVAGDKLFVDCSSGVVTVTLPSTPSQGDEIRIIDATGNAETNNITIDRNGNNIQGVGDNLIIETNRAAFGLVYYNATQGWLLMER